MMSLQGALTAEMCFPAKAEGDLGQTTMYLCCATVSAQPHSLCSPSHVPPKPASRDHASAIKRACKHLA